MEQLAFRNLVGVAYTEAEVKEFAEEYQYAADPDEEGNPTERPGKLSDYFPNPYPNEEAAKFANSGMYMLCSASLCHTCTCAYNACVRCYPTCIAEYTCSWFRS